MKKILYVATVDIHIKSFHLPYLKMLKENGYEVHVATNGKEEFPYCDVKHQICIERNPINLKNIKAVHQLKKIIAKEKFDIIHCHTPMGSVVTRLAARKARNKHGTKVIYTVHGFHFYKGAPIKNWLLFYPVEWYLAKYTDILVTINQEDFKRAEDKLKKRCKNIEYIPGIGVDPKKFEFEMNKEEKIKLRESLGIDREDFVLTYIARLDKNKNQGFLIECIGELALKYKNVHLLLIGRDELNGYYQKIVKALNIGKNVHFLGNRDDVPKLLKISDVGISVSKREGLGLNLIETLYSEVPVVAIDNRGHRDIVKNGQNGYLIMEYNKKEFQEKICKIYSDKELYNKLKKQARKSVSKFDLSYTLKLMKDIYDKK